MIYKFPDAVTQKVWRKLHFTTLNRTRAEKIEEGSKEYQEWLAAPQLLFQDNLPKLPFYELELKTISTGHQLSEFEEEAYSMATSKPYSYSLVEEPEPKKWEEIKRIEQLESPSVYETEAEIYIKEVINND